MSIEIYNIYKRYTGIIKSMSILMLLTGVFSLNAYAQPPYNANLIDGGNKWLLDAYDDTDPDHVFINTVGICFKYAGTKGSHQLYTWYSDTFKGWQGTASQEGDQIFMHGRYANGKGRDAIQVTIIIDTPRSGSVGHWQEWRDDDGYGQVIGFSNARMIRDPGAVCAITEKEALDDSFIFPFFPSPTTTDNPMTYKP